MKIIVGKLHVLLHDYNEAWLNIEVFYEGYKMSDSMIRKVNLYDFLDNLRR